MKRKNRKEGKGREGKGKERKGMKRKEGGGEGRMVLSDGWRFNFYADIIIVILLLIFQYFSLTLLFFLYIFASFFV